MVGMKEKQYIKECTSPAQLKLLLNSLVVIIMINEQVFNTLYDEDAYIFFFRLAYMINEVNEVEYITLHYITIFNNK